MKARMKIGEYLALDARLRVLLLTGVIMNLGGSLWGSLLGLYLTNNLGVPILMFGLMNTTRELVSSLAIFPSGFLSDNFGRKKMMVLSMIFSVSSLVVLFFANELLWLFLVPVFQGLSIAFMGPSRSAYVTDVVPPERRGVAYATLALLQSPSTIAATYIAGLIAGAAGFFWVFCIALVLEAIALLGTALFLDESLGEGSGYPKLSERNLTDQLKNGFIMLKNPPLLAVLFAIVFHQLGLGVQSPYLTIYASRVLAYSLPTIGFVLSMEQMGILTGHFPSGKIVDKYGGEVSFAFHIVATSPSMILFAITGDPVYTGAILFLWGVTFGLDNVSRQSLIAKYKSESGVATAFGIISLIAGVVSLVSPTLGGWIWTNFSPQTVFYASAAVNVLGSLPLFTLWLYGRRTRD